MGRDRRAYHAAYYAAHRELWKARDAQRYLDGREEKIRYTANQQRTWGREVKNSRCRLRAATDPEYRERRRLSRYRYKAGLKARGVWMQVGCIVGLPPTLLAKLHSQGGKP